MAEFPMLPLWTDAYLADTTHLTTIEHGAYLLLLIAMWRTKEKRLPNDDKLLARFCRTTPGQWARIKPSIIGFFKAAEGHLYQPRLTDEANVVRQHSKKQSDKARARWLKSNDTGDAAAMPEGMPGGCPLPTPISNESDTYSEYLFPPTESDTSAPPSPVGAGAAPSKSSRYRWEGRIIRLNDRDFTRWAASFKHLCLEAELESLDAWLVSPEATEKHRKGWLHVVAGALKNRNDAAKAKHDAGRLRLVTPTGSNRAASSSSYDDMMDEDARYYFAQKAKAQAAAAGRH
jgi:uncharacterized protein YdaU (DUF1376 family)